MDDYKKYFYQSRANTKIPEFGNVSKRVALRKQLECKPFKWYLDTLLPNMFIPECGTPYPPSSLGAHKQTPTETQTRAHFISAVAFVVLHFVLY